MKTLLRTAAVVAALGLAAAPAYAQRINTGQEGSYGRVSLQTGFEPDPFTVTVSAGGPIDASTLSDTCTGFIPARASYTLQYRAGDTLPLIISTTSDNDTVLAVRGPNGQWSCNDDNEGTLNAAVRYDNPRTGRYQIWVGMFGAGGSGPALLHISEVGAGIGGSVDGPPDFSLDPAYGSIDLVSGFEPDPHTQSIAAGGSYDATGLGQPGCVGWIARAPDYRVNWTAGDNNLPLIFSVAADADTTLVINDAGGNWICDDDGGEHGLNPSIRFESPASGQYDIWIGTFQQGELQQSTLHVSELTTQ